VYTYFHQHRSKSEKLYIIRSIVKKLCVLHVNSGAKVWSMDPPSDTKTHQKRESCSLITNIIFSFHVIKHLLRACCITFLGIFCKFFSSLFTKGCWKFSAGILTVASIVYLYTNLYCVLLTLLGCNFLLSHGNEILFIACITMARDENICQF
jgi:hypothetical protein